MKEKDQAQGSNMETHVHIFGPLRLQNELMCEFLERSTGLKCSFWEIPGQNISDLRTNLKTLILWDCIDTDPDSLWSKIDVGLKSESLLALFNVSPGLGISKEVVDRGVHGIFFDNESPTTFTKGYKLF